MTPPLRVLTDAVVIRIRKTTDESQLDIDVGITPGMEDLARDALERMFGYVVGSRTLDQVRPYVAQITQRQNRELVTRTRKV